LSHACAVSAGQEALDVAAGDGNFALACAREGASVVASDFAPGMVRSGRARTEREGHEIEWMEAELVETTPTFAAAREGLPGDAFEQLSQATLELIKRHNVATDGTLRIDAEYLITVARKRG
jgi:tRNA/tmRNA/rRNA uracil-C5-methylase (TrmA/RlmC/RlmD family)